MLIIFHISQCIKIEDHEPFSMEKWLLALLRSKRNCPQEMKISYLYWVSFSFIVFLER